MRRLAGALCLVALVSFPRAAAAQVIPLADCVTEGSSQGLIQAWFGYRNLDSTVVSIPIGLDNFFSPGAVDRGQPSAFEPGEFHRLFAVEIAASTSITWFLSGVQAPADATLPSCDQPLTWLGPWDMSATYERNQIVSYLGSSWIALRRNAAEAPGTGTDWDLLAQKGETGPHGLQGERGEQGPQGVPGPEGVPGSSPSASPIFTVPRNGRLTIADETVKEDSVVIAVYVGGLRAGGEDRRDHRGSDDDEDRDSLKSPAVIEVDTGRITILARPGRRIRYVVFR